MRRKAAARGPIKPETGGQGMGNSDPGTGRQVAGAAQGWLLVAANCLPTLAIVSLVTGILSFLQCCNFFIMPIVAVVTGILAKKEIKQKPDQLTGDGLALAGIILGVLGFLIYTVLVILQVTMGLLGNM